MCVHAVAAAAMHIEKTLAGKINLSLKSRIFGYLKNLFKIKRLLTLVSFIIEKILVKTRLF